MNAAKRYAMVPLVTYIIGLFDPYGVNHSERVAQMSVKIGERLGMTEAELEDLELAAQFHDIGKLGVPESIRTKPGRLTEAEYFMMQQHPLMGVNILKRMNGSIHKVVHQAVYYHHENWNGTGYPDKLKGDAIPLEARIIRVADTFDALTQSRGYRMPLTEDQAATVMMHDQDTSQIFAPDVFQAFLEVIAKG